MNVLVRLWMAMVICLLITISCGGGGGGGSDNITEAALKLSQDKGIPGTFITLEDDSINKGEDLNVTFSDSSGFEVTLRSLFVEDGSAKIPVPPYIGEETGDFEAGTVKISIANGNQADFQIEALPDIEGLEAGYVVKAYLEVIRDNFKAHLLSMDEFEAEYGYDTEEMKDQIQMQIDDIEYTLDELFTTGTVSIDSEHFGRSILSESELKTIDQLLYAMSMGIYNERNPASLQLRAVRGSSLWELEEQIDTTVEVCKAVPNNFLPWPKDALDSIKETISAAEAFFTEKGGYAGRKVFSKGKEILSLPITGLKGFFSGLYDGFRCIGGKCEASEETKDLGKEALKAITPEIIEDTEGWFNTFSPIVKWILKKKCEIGVGDYSFFCNNTEKSRLQVVSANFVPTVVQSGTKAHLKFTINELLVSPDFAKNSYIHIDWGDGDGSELRWGESHSHKALIGNAERDHTYSLLPGEESYTYTAWVSVKGDNDADFSHALSASVKIVRDIDPITIDFNGPKTLSVNQVGTWTMDVSGGFGPYQGRLNWGGGSTITGTNLFGEFKASHRYKTAGLKTITFDVTDTDRKTGIIKYPVTVIGETETCQLDYWSHWVTTGIDAEITFSGDPDYPTITWSHADGKLAKELYIQSYYNSENVYNLQGDIPNVVTYGDYSYPGTSVGWNEYCYRDGRLCTDVIPFSQIYGGEHGYEIWINFVDGGDLRMTFSIDGETCPE